MKYVFILGHNPKLSAAEVLAVLPKAKVVTETSSFLIIENSKIDCEEILKQLGGTIKIGEVVSDGIDTKIIVENLKNIKVENKLNFGLSYYDCPKDDLGMEIKKELKADGVSCRLVVSRDKALSSVVVTKNKCHEFLILENKWLGQTCAIQEFEEYSKRDFGRPVRDMISGSMPPKLAKIMINLAQMKKSASILDPFCGSGTMLQEALMLGYQNVAGIDISEKAIEDTKNNLEWLVQTYNLQPTLHASQAKRATYNLFKFDVRELFSKVSGVDAIITEPYLGPPLKGNESEEKMDDIVAELSDLYLGAFTEFKKVLNKNGKVVIILPSFKLEDNILELSILGEIKKMGFTQHHLQSGRRITSDTKSKSGAGFTQINEDKLIYSRQGQKVYRNIFVFTL